jgi:hypothetical protein
MSKLIGKLIVVVFAGWCGSASSALIDRGNGLIYDNDLDVTWLQDANYIKTSGYTGPSNIPQGEAGSQVNGDGGLSWESALLWANTLVFGGYSEWRLPNTNECFRGLNPNATCTGSELIHLYDVEGISSANPGLFINLQASRYWTDREFVRPNSFYMGMVNGQQDITYQLDRIFAIAAHDGDIAMSAVPIPATIWLFGFALLGLMGAARRKKV